MAESAFKSKGGIRRVFNAARYSLQGFRFAFRNEAAFRQELALVLVLVPVALWLAKTRWELLALIAPLFLVLIVEVLNSSLEALADEISVGAKPRLGAAKDLGSAAVFLSLVLVVFTWALVLWP